MHYYQFNIGDYTSHTARLSIYEDLAYRRLLDTYYLNERPFNECCNSVARDIGMSDHIDSVQFVLSKYFELIDGFWVHHRVEEEIKNYKNKLESASKAGKASAKARKIKSSERSLNGRCQSVEPTNNHKPITNNHKPITNNQVKTISSTSRFIEFWDLYQKKVDRPKCEKRFAKLTVMEIEKIFNVIRDYIESTPDPQYRKNPLTWLNGECWNDEIRHVNMQTKQMEENMRVLQEWEPD